MQREFQNQWYFTLFWYKKAPYLYLIELYSNIITKEVDEKSDYEITDFFDRIKLSSSIEISVMKKHPAIPSLEMEAGKDG